METVPIDRRSILKLGALALAGSTAAFGPAISAEPASAQTASFTLPKPRVAENLIARQVAGLRPFRPSGFVVKKETLGDKTIIHDYGHGGCGVTLSWGTANMALGMALETDARTAAVIGCGAVGLATARLLQDHGFEVSIYAQDLPPNTTSNVAGAMFGVTSLVDDAHHTPQIAAQIQQAVRFAHRYFQYLVGDRYGVHWNDMYFLGQEPIELPWDFTITPELFPLTQYGPGEHPFPTPYAASIHTMMIEPYTYLPQVTDDFLRRGGKLVVRSFTGMNQLEQLAEPLIMNCTGLGSKTLFGDEELVPIKGQLTLLQPQPDIKYAYLDGRRDLYMFPRHDVIILGGSHQEGVTSLEPDPVRAKEILDGHKEIAENMK